MYNEDLAEGGIMFIPVPYFSFNTEAADPNDIEAISVRYYRILSPRYNPDYSFYKDLIAVLFPILSADDKIFELFKPPITFPSLFENRQSIVYTAETALDTSDDPEQAGSPAEEIYGTEKVQEFEAKGYARYQRHFENKTAYFEADKEQSLMNIIELCKVKNVTPVLITTPFTIYYNQYIAVYQRNSRIESLFREALNRAASITI